MNNNNNFYVYEWFIKETGHVFHVGKGKDDRYKEKIGRNIYFTRIVNKYDTDVRIYKDHLSEDEAWEIEKQHIIELKKLGQCETNIHEGGCGGDTVSAMPEDMYKEFCHKVGQKTAERSHDQDYFQYWLNTVKNAMQRPEVRQKISDRTTKAMHTESVYESMWERGLANPVMIVFKNKSYKVFKLIGDYKKYLRSNFQIGQGWAYKLFKREFKIGRLTKDNKNISQLVGAKAYQINKKLFKSVTTMADECKPVEEILSLFQAQDN